MKAGYYLTARAKQDLREIGLYSHQTWGSVQTKKYLAEMQLVFKELSAFPKLGRLRKEIAPGLRSFKLGHHIVYYIAREDQVIFVRLLHPSMDIKQAFPEKRNP